MLSISKHWSLLNSHWCIAEVLISANVSSKRIQRLYCAIYYKNINLCSQLIAWIFLLRRCIFCIPISLCHPNMIGILWYSSFNIRIFHFKCTILFFLLSLWKDNIYSYINLNVKIVKMCSDIDTFNTTVTKLNVSASLLSL